MRVGLLATATGTAMGAALLSGCGGGDDFTEQSGKEIATRAKSAMGDLKSVTVKGSVTAGGKPVDIDLALSTAGDCTGTIGIAGGSTELRGVDGTVWLRPDAAFWKAATPDTADKVQAVVGDKWVLFPDEDGGFGDLCDLDDLLDELVEEHGATYSKAGEETLAGDDVVAVTSKDDGQSSTGYVRVDEPHYLVKMERTEGDQPGSVTFSGFDEDVDVEAPADSEVADLSALTG